MHRALLTTAFTVLLLTAPHAFAQRQPPPDTAPTPRAYPKEIRGYRLERARVEIKSPGKTLPEDKTSGAPSSPDGALIQFGKPRVVRVTPLGITLELHVTVAAVKQGGRVDFLSFEDVVVNGMPVSIEDYQHPFDLPTERPLTLPAPVRVFVSTTRALLGAVGEWNESKDVWPVVGRVYVFGHFKKFLMKFKRVVPVELDLSLPNPLKDETAETGAKSVSMERNEIDVFRSNEDVELIKLKHSGGCRRTVNAFVHSAGLRLCQSVSC